jgi:hypothetical protein
MLFEPLVQPAEEGKADPPSLAAFDHDTTLIAVIEMSLTGWLVAGIVPV